MKLFLVTRKGKGAGVDILWSQVIGHLPSGHYLFMPSTVSHQPPKCVGAEKIALSSHYMFLKEESFSHRFHSGVL